MEESKDKKDSRQTLKIPADLHREIKIAAANQGREMYALLSDVWDVYRAQHGMDWAEKERTVQSLLGDLSPVEELTLRAVLEVLRDDTLKADDWRTAKPSLISLGKQWASRNRGRTT